MDLLSAICIILALSLIASMTGNSILRRRTARQENHRKRMLGRWTEIKHHLEASGIKAQSSDIIDSENEIFWVGDRDGQAGIRISLSLVNDRWGTFWNFPDGSRKRLTQDDMTYLRTCLRTTARDLEAHIRAKM